MVNQSNDDSEIDPQLSELFELIKNVPARDVQEVERRRDAYLSAVNSLVATERNTFRTLLLGLFATNKFGISRSTKLVYSALIVVIAISIVVLSGFSATAYAAQNALPGDMLYQVKTSLEQVQVNLTPNAAQQAQLHLRLAERRLEEISGLIKDGRFGEIQYAALQFEYHLQKAIQAMNILANTDPEKANSLADQIADAIARYSQILTGMVNDVPEDIQPSLEHAIDLSQNASDAERDYINNMDLLNENESGNEDGGSDVLNSNSSGNGEIEIDNDNINEHSNSNLNNNENENSNSDDDDDGNDNDRSGNANTNHNDNNDESNSNDNENRGDNDNSNNNKNNNNNDNSNRNGGD